MNMNEDVIVEILLRLPVKSLLRCKSVCKKWFEIIDSSEFIDSHLISNFCKRSILIKHFDVDKYQTILTSYDPFRFTNENSNGLLELSPPLSVISIDGDMNIITHCNGIVCMMKDRLSNSITLLNPSSKESRSISIPRRFGCPSGFNSYTFGVGFWFNKVVRLVWFRSISNSSFPKVTYVESQVYDLTANSSSWRLSSSSSSGCIYDVDRVFGYRPRPCSAFNGILHYCFTRTLTADRVSFNILAFDLTTESFQVMEFPGCLRDLDYDYDLGKVEKVLPDVFVVDQSTIGLVLFTGPDQTYSSHYRCGSSLDIWVMKDYGVTDSWIKQSSIELSTSFGIRKPVSFWDKDILLFFTRGCTLRCHDLRSCQEHQMQWFQPVIFSSFYTSFGVVIYNQSLVSVNKIQGFDQ